MSYSTGIDKPVWKPRDNQCRLTDKQVIKAVWAFDMHKTPALTETLKAAARERGIKLSALTEKKVTELLLLCGWRP